MRLATIRTDRGSRAALVVGDVFRELDAPDVGTLLHDAGWRASVARDDGPEHSRDDVSIAPLVPRPGKILCVGLNYRTHILEMGREIPRYPTVFAKFSEALIGATDDIDLPPESDAADWEGELCIVLGAAVRRADREAASAAIAGFTIMNDITMRDWQYRSAQWLQGKTFEGTTPLGPVLVTPDEIEGGLAPALRIRTELDGEVVQEANTSDLVFGPVDLVRYLSSVVTLQPGDLIATGTPGGVGHAHVPPRYLRHGQTLVTSIQGIGTLRNMARSA